MSTTVNDEGYIVPSSTEPAPYAGLDELLENLPGFNLLTERMKLAALAGSVMPDSNGVWPGQPNYVTTHDHYFAALNLIAFLRAQPVVRQASSEGTSVATDAPDWSGLVAYFRSLSPISQANNGGVISTVAIPSTPHVMRTDMSGRDGFGRMTHYGDVDTDA